MRLAALLAAAALLAGCTAEATDLPQKHGISAVEVPADVTPLSPAPRPVLPVTVTDATGARVTVARADRVVASNLSGTLGEIVVALGLRERLVGRDRATTLPSVAAVPEVTTAHDLSAEGVLRLAPDVLLVDSSTGPPEAVAAIRQAGVSVVTVPTAWSLEAVGPRIRAVAAALGVAQAGEALAERTDREVAAARATLTAGREKPLNVAFLYLRGTAGVYLIAGRGSGPDSLLHAVGARDAGTALGLERFRPLTAEGLVRAAPDVLLLMEGGLASVGGVDGLLGVAGVAQTPAGRDRRVVTMDDGSLLSFGPRTGAVLQVLAARLAAA